MPDTPVPPTALGEDMARQLRRAQFERGLTQAQMARLLRVSTKHLNQVMNSRAGADHRTLDRWARRLGYRWQVKLVSVRDHAGALTAIPPAPVGSAVISEEDRDAGTDTTMVGRLAGLDDPASVAGRDGPGSGLAGLAGQSEVGDAGALTVDLSTPGEADSDG